MNWLERAKAHFSERPQGEPPETPNNPASGVLGVGVLGISEESECVSGVLGVPPPDLSEKTQIDRCARCAHLRRQGSADGYCGAGRDDLPPAYGASHPLRRLPDDNGQACDLWEGWR